MLKIVEYKPFYAKAVADMWRKSSEGWNGGFANETEESVLKELEGSTSINTYLAECDGEILGYCDFSQYLEDEGALYIKLLNVRYDCHGKGIGRTLVCKSVERTVELGWPRLDLYTWPGNKKSIPLYKRCGFFFEDREDTTHLMNFMPYVLNTEAVKEFFEEVHWYKDLKRTIDLKPDGKKENGFDFYEYLWEKDGKTLRMEFERKGRGLRLIETEDYIIAAVLPKQDLIFGQKYNINYEVINKSHKPLNISIKGTNNKNIKFDFEASMEVKEKEVIEGEFFVDEFTEEPNPFKTHPVVASEIFINGKKAEFKLGIVPKRPAEIALVGTNAFPYTTNKESYKNVISKMYLDVENSFDEEATFKFTLANNENIEFLNNEFELSMNAKEKNSFEVSYVLKNYCFYSEPIFVTAVLKDGRTIEFNKTITSVFRGREGAFGGEAEDYFIIVNGAYSVKQSKLNNKVYLRGFEEADQKTFFNVPKVGRPFTAEFYNIRPSKVTWYSEGACMVLKSTCISEAFKNIEVTTVFKLLANGIIEHYHEIYNNSGKETREDIFLLQGTYHDMGKGVLPIDNKIVEIANKENEAIANFNLANITENWLFSRNKELTRGLWWNGSLRPKMDDWFISFEHSLGKIPAYATVITEPINVAMNTFKCWEELRQCALGKKSAEVVNSVEDLEISINKGNPFVKEKFYVEVIEHKQEWLSGEFTINSENAVINTLCQSLSEEDECKKIQFILDAEEQFDFEVLKVEADLNLTTLEKRRAIFGVKDYSIKEEVIEEQGHSIYCASNGVMTIKISPSFSPALYSMEYKNHQWLESSFPTPKAKSWFNPWVGGILNIPEGLGLRSILEENIEGNFAALKDSCDNEWRGVKTHYCINKNERFRGLELNEYYLMLPGIPVLCHTTEIIQNTGRLMNSHTFENLNFFNGDEDIKNNYVLIKNTQGDNVKYKAGREAEEFLVDKSIIVGGKSLKEKLQVFTNLDKAKLMLLLSTNDTGCFVYEKITAAHKERRFTTPVFYILTDEKIEDKLLKDLKNIYF